MRIVVRGERSRKGILRVCRRSQGLRLLIIRPLLMGVVELAGALLRSRRWGRRLRRRFSRPTTTHIVCPTKSKFPSISSSKIPPYPLRCNPNLFLTHLFYPTSSSLRACNTRQSTKWAVNIKHILTYKLMDSHRRMRWDRQLLKRAEWRGITCRCR